LTISLSSEALASAGFSHGFSTREVDLRFDAPDYAGNLKRFALASGIDPARWDGIAQARQVHGVQVVDAKTMSVDALLLGSSSPSSPSLPSVPKETLPQADAVVAEPGFAAGVRTADCVPILVGDPVSGVAAAIHAGWRGTVAGVIACAMERFARAGGDPARAVAAIGPCICAACFEVGDDVAELISQATQPKGTPAEPVVTRADKAHANLRLAVRLLLGRAGVRTIEDVPGCTRCETDRFFSYRRDRTSGRHLAAIAAPNRVV